MSHNISEQHQKIITRFGIILFITSVIQGCVTFPQTPLTFSQLGVATGYAVNDRTYKLKFAPNERLRNIDAQEVALLHAALFANSRPQCLHFTVLDETPAPISQTIIRSDPLYDPWFRADFRGYPYRYWRGNSAFDARFAYDWSYYNGYDGFPRYQQIQINSPISLTITCLAQKPVDNNYFTTALILQELAPRYQVIPDPPAGSVVPISPAPSKKRSK